MYLKNTLLPLVGIAFTGTLTSALQINIYSDGNCGNFMGSYYPGECDPIPAEVGSWLIVCKDGEACSSIEFFNSNGGGCADEHAVTGLQCSCNADPWNPSDSGECHSTWGLGVSYWGYRLVDNGNLP
ncbi:hypothetical protein BGZ63DRAFT_425308 [Mariannaea sp. PMI_226]|nr:hypothetical protein BGZ63DRAFT_425308 [Mariannaea sp. PMI_226]